MIPINYITKSNITRFIYNTKELKNWIKLGNKDGNVGMILHSYVGKFTKYIGYGTIENPYNHRNTLTFVHNPLLDGKRSTPDEIINYKPTNIFKDAKIVLLDISKKE